MKSIKLQRKSIKSMNLWNLTLWNWILWNMKLHMYEFMKSIKLHEYIQKFRDLNLESIWIALKELWKCKLYIYLWIWNCINLKLYLWHLILPSWLDLKFLLLSRLLFFSSFFLYLSLFFLQCCSHFFHFFYFYVGCIPCCDWSNFQIDTYNNK